MRTDRFNPRAALLILSTVAMVHSSGCGSSPTAAPERSIIQVKCDCGGDYSPAETIAYGKALRCVLTEHAGLGATFNYVHIRAHGFGDKVDEAEIDANGIAAAAGTNRISANGRLVGNFKFDFATGTGAFWDLAVLEFNYTDDRQNTGTVTWTWW